MSPWNVRLAGSAHTALSGWWRASALGALGDALHEQIRAAEDAAAWLHEQPANLRRELLLLRVLCSRCPRRQLLLSAYEMPATSSYVLRSGGQRCLMVPHSRARFGDSPRVRDRLGDDPEKHARPFWLRDGDAWVLRCRCSPSPTRVTAAQLTSDAPLIDGLNVVLA